jgi:SAM-dependent methyltransferase
MSEEPRDAELHTMDPTGRFSDRAADYVRYRPDYPAAAIDAVIEGLARPLLAADVGAGTGIAARALADREVGVIAIEPNAAMRAAAAPHARITWRDGAAEATGLADASVGLVLCAQAFHWFRHAEALAEFARVLPPGGRLALLWNARDHDDPLTRGYIEAIHAVGGEHPAERRCGEPGELDRVLALEPRFEPAEALTFPHAQPLDAAGLLGRATSASYVPKEGEALADLRERLARLHAHHADANGRVWMRYETRLWRLRRAPSVPGGPTR